MLAAVRAWGVRCRLRGALGVAARTASSLRLVRPLCTWRRAAALQRSDDGLLSASLLCFRRLALVRAAREWRAKWFLTLTFTLPLTAHRSPLTAHRSPLTAHLSP